MNNWSHSTSARSRELVSPCFEYKGHQWNKYREWCTKVDILHITVTYVTATINRKTRNGDPATGSDGSSQTRQNPRVNGYGYGFGPPRSSESGFWTVLELNRNVFPSNSGPLVGYPYPLLTLITANGHCVRATGCKRWSQISRLAYKALHEDLESTRIWRAEAHLNIYGMNDHLMRSLRDRYEVIYD